MSRNDSGITDDAHFTNQLYARRSFHAALYCCDKTFDIGGSRRCIVVDDEVGVFRTDFGTAESQSFEASGLDEPCGKIARRITKHGTRIGPAQGLAGNTFFKQGANGVARSGLVLRRKPEPRCGKDFTLSAYIARRHMPIANLEIG